MIDYINAIKRGFRDKYGYVPDPEKSTDGEPVFGEGQIPDGEYPMEINDKVDRVLIKNGMIHCCRWEESVSA